MDDGPVFTAAAAERRSLADLLDGLDAEQWAAASWCAGWDVRTVAAHVAGALEPALLPFLVAVLRHGGRVHRANDALARAGARRPHAEIAQVLRARADSRASPPVTGPRAPLTDVLVHTGDIARPLGLEHRPAPAAVRMGLDFVTSGRPVGFVPRSRLRGLRLVADDLDGAWGSGAVVAGRGLDLLMAACGRPGVLGELHGPGVTVLSGRLRP